MLGVHSTSKLNLTCLLDWEGLCANAHDFTILQRERGCGVREGEEEEESSMEASIQGVRSPLGASQRHWEASLG